MTSPAYWVSRVPVLSTAHVSRETMEWLIANPGDHEFGVVANYSHGVFLQLDNRNEAPEAPAEIRQLQQWIRPRHYQWIRLDTNGDVVPGLPIHDW